MTNAPMIDVREATKKYDDGPPALAGVTLSVASGDCVAILGHSGSGKSTLLNLIAGLDKPSSGSVTVDGTRVDQLGEAGSAKYRRASIGMIFQFFHLLDDLTVLDNVMVPAQLAGMGRVRRSAGPSSCSARWVSSGMSRLVRSGCPVVSGSGWRWPGL